MVTGIGIDTTIVSRIAEKLNGEPGLKEQLYSSAEIEDSERRPHPARWYAVRFAAKEALMKALGHGPATGIPFRDVELTLDNPARPTLRLHNKAFDLLAARQVNHLHVAIAATRTETAALVLLESKEN